MTGSQRHTIFVALDKDSPVLTGIYLSPGPDFRVRGNGFDAPRLQWGPGGQKPQLG